MLLQRGFPLMIVALLVLILLVWAIIYRTRKKDLDAEQRLLAERRWTGVCAFDNPETGAKCQREEFHLENHYREVNRDGHIELVVWGSPKLNGGES